MDHVDATNLIGFGQVSDGPANLRWIELPERPESMARIYTSERSSTPIAANQHRKLFSIVES